MLLHYYIKLDNNVKEDEFWRRYKLSQNKEKTGIIMPPLFSKGDKFNWFNLDGSINKSGIIKYLRNDEWEKENSHKKGNYYYSVDFTDGSFETYLSENVMVKIN